MATIKSYTDISQSKTLSKILPLESADMCYLTDITFGGKCRLLPKDDFACGDSLSNLPCWSLASLLEQLHYEVCDDDGYSTYLQINKDDDMYQLEYTDPSGILESIETDRYEHFVDACVAMIERLYKLKML